MSSHLSPLCCRSGSLGWIICLLCPKLCSEGRVCFVFGWTAVYFHAEIMPLFLLAVNSISTKQLHPYMSAVRPTEMLARADSLFKGSFLALERAAAPCWPTRAVDASWHTDLVKIQDFSLVPILLNGHDFTLTLLPCVQDLEGMLVFLSHLWCVKVAVWAKHPLSILVEKSATDINWSEVMWSSANSL